MPPSRKAAYSGAVIREPFLDTTRRRRIEVFSGSIIALIAGAWLVFGPRAVVGAWHDGQATQDRPGALWGALAFSFMIPGALYVADIGLLRHRDWAPRFYAVAFLVPQILALLAFGSGLWRGAGGLALASYAFLWADLVALLPLITAGAPSRGVGR